MTRGCRLCDREVDPGTRTTLCRRCLFWSRVSRTDTCWLWTGAMTSYGYGIFYNFPQNPPRHAHRVAYELEVGPIPEGLTIDHLCCVKQCVNPAHLEPVTQGENTQRFYRQMTRCKRGHEYTPENTYVYVDRRDGYRRRKCQTCRRDRDRARSGVSVSQESLL